MLILRSYVFSLVYWSLELYSWIVVVYLIASFLINNRYASWFVFLGEMIDPVLDRLRSWTGGRLQIERFDLSPILLFIGIRLVQYLFQKLLIP